MRHRSSRVLLRSRLADDRPTTAGGTNQLKAAYYFVGIGDSSSLRAEVHITLICNPPIAAVTKKTIHHDACSAVDITQQRGAANLDYVETQLC